MSTLRRGSNREKSSTALKILFQVMQDLQTGHGEGQVECCDDEERLLGTLVVEGREGFGEEAGEGDVVLHDGMDRSASAR